MEHKEINHNSKVEIRVYSPSLFRPSSRLPVDMQTKANTKRIYN